MAFKPLRQLRKAWHQAVRNSIASLPRSWRFAVFRSFASCDPHPDPRLVLKIAETQEELEACFQLLHDAYVQAGFMKPDPSGLRVTLYHALPTTTTLCAKYDGRVVGTLSLIRESAMGFPLQAIFDLSGVREKQGQLAEVSALAVHPDFRKTGGMILFPLMRFMREYCTSYFDTRHLVIAVNPDRIEMYESLFFFERLTARTVENYDFANGAPAVGASVDLKAAPEIFKRYYAGKSPRKNLHAYFFNEKPLTNIQLPKRRYYTTNDPVLTPELLDYFFNQRTQGFAKLDEHKKAILHGIYADQPGYLAVLPALADSRDKKEKRFQKRFSVRCPGQLTILYATGQSEQVDMEVIEMSHSGFQALARKPLPLRVWSDAIIRLGQHEVSHVKAMAEHGSTQGDYCFYGFQLGAEDFNWRKFVSALNHATLHGDMDEATRFLALSQMTAAPEQKHVLH